MYLYIRNTPRGFGHQTNNVIYIHIIHVHNTCECRTEVYNNVYRHNIPYTHTRTRAQTKVHFRRENRITISRSTIILFSPRYVYVYICSYIPWSWGFFPLLPVECTMSSPPMRVAGTRLGSPGISFFGQQYYIISISFLRPMDPREITAILARADAAAPISRAVN